MGLFTPNFTKEGKGVYKDTPEKNRFFLFFELFFGHFSKLICVNFVYFFTMLPLFLGVYLSVDFKTFPFKFTGDIVGLICMVVSVFTSFPMTAGFTYVIRNMQRREHAWIIRDMFKHAKENYWKTVANGAVQILAYIILYIAFITYRTTVGGQIGFFLSFVVLAITLFFVWMQFYMNTMIVTFDLKLSQIYKNAAIFSIIKLPLNLFITVVCCAFTLVVCSYFTIYLNVILLALIYLSLYGFFTVYCIYPAIDKNMIAKSRETEPDTDTEVQQ